MQYKMTILSMMEVNLMESSDSSYGSDDVPLYKTMYQKKFSFLMKNQVPFSLSNKHERIRFRLSFFWKGIFPERFFPF